MTTDVSPTVPETPDRNLALELVRVTEAAAMAAARWVGRGDKNGADGAAVNAMRALVQSVSMHGVVVIGEGEKDDAPMLFNGEEVGDGSGPEVDVAVDPIDGTTLCAKGMPNAIAVLAVSERGTMYDPSAVFYMEKLVTGPAAADVVDIEAPIADNLAKIAKAKSERVEDLTVVILDRPRHETHGRRDPRGRRPHQVHLRRRRRRRDHGRARGHRRRPARSASAARPRASSPPAPSSAWAASSRASSGRRTTPSARRALDAGHDLDRVLHTDDLVTGDNVFFVGHRHHRRRAARGRALPRRHRRPRTRSSCAARAAPSAR